MLSSSSPSHASSSNFKDNDRLLLPPALLEEQLLVHELLAAFFDSAELAIPAETEAALALLREGSFEDGSLRSGLRWSVVAAGVAVELSLPLVQPSSPSPGVDPALPLLEIRPLRPDWWDHEDSFSDVVAPLLLAVDREPEASARLLDFVASLTSRIEALESGPLVDAPSIPSLSHRAVKMERLLCCSKMHRAPSLSLCHAQMTLLSSDLV